MSNRGGGGRPLSVCGSWGSWQARAATHFQLGRLWARHSPGPSLVTQHRHRPPSRASSGEGLRGDAEGNRGWISKDPGPSHSWTPISLHLRRARRAAGPGKRTFYFHKYSCSHSHTDPTRPRQRPVTEGDALRTPMHDLPWPGALEPPAGAPRSAMTSGPAVTAPTAPRKA